MTPPTTLAVLTLACLPASAQLGPPPVPAGNPITPEKVLLGKALFFEEQLSSTRSLACGTCHDPLAGGGDPRASTAEALHPGPDGVFGTADDAVGSLGAPRSVPGGTYRFHQSFGLAPQVTRRQTTGTFTGAYDPSLFWDGRAGEVLVEPTSGEVVLASGAALEVQALEPLLSPREMGSDGRTWSDVVQRLEESTPLALATDLGALGTWIAGRDYPALFEEAFGDEDITPARIAMALATYQRTLVPTDTPVDPLIAGLDHDLTDQELRGGTLFRTPETTGCIGCHTLPLYADGEFHYTGVRPVDQDPGRFAVTGDPADMGKVRTPSLRNVELTAPYFMDGRFATLEEVVDFYDRGGDFDAPNKDPRIRPLGLTAEQKADLVAYLRRPFTDLRVLAGTAPFDRPTLYGGSDREPAAYGAPSDGSGGFLPRLVAVEPPLVGGPEVTLGIDRGMGGAPAVLLVGTAPDRAGTPFQGATVHVALNAGLVRFSTPLFGSGPGTGWASLRVDPPPLAGQSLFAQWLVFDQHGPERFSATEAVRMTGF